VQSVQELIALAKAKPGELKFGSSGYGSNPHLHAELFRLVTGTDIRHIPYKGSGPLSTDLLGGRLEMAFQVPITVITFITGGKLRALAVTGEQRLNALAQTPTFTEEGLANFGLPGITGIVTNAKAPRVAVERLSRELAAVVASPDAADFMVKQGAEPFVNDARQTTVIVREEVARYAKVIKAAGITLQH
jgi:tripartite-type tricarboxylate transporter receptor subunit TctC